MRVLCAAETHEGVVFSIFNHFYLSQFIRRIGRLFNCCLLRAVWWEHALSWEIVACMVEVITLNTKGVNVTEIEVWQVFATQVVPDILHFFGCAMFFFKVEHPLEQSRFLMAGHLAAPE